MKEIFVSVRFAAICGLAGIAIAAAAAAQAVRSDPRLGAIEQRQAEMKRLGASMKLLAGFSKGEAVNAMQAKAAAEAVRGVSQRVHRFWPEGTEAGVGKSKAKAEIWSDQAGFRERMFEFRVAAVGMERAAGSGNRVEVARALGPLGGSCKSCHTPFQAKD